MQLIKIPLTKFVCTLLSLVLIIGTFTLLPNVVTATTSTTQIQNDINANKKKVTDLTAQLKKIQASKNNEVAQRDALQAQINANQSIIDDCNNLIASFNSQIATQLADIDKKQKELASDKTKLQARFKAIYMSDNSSSLEILVSSDNFSNFLFKDMFVQSIAKNDTQLMNTCQQNIATINTETADVQSKKSAQTQLVNEKQAAQDDLTTKQAAVNAVIIQISKTASDTQKAITDTTTDMNALEENLKKIAEENKRSHSPQIFNPGSGGMFAWPVPGFYTITSPFGYRNNPTGAGTEFHKGMDISGGGIYGQPIVAAADGKVMIAGNVGNGYGNYVVIEHGILNGIDYMTVYGHMSSVETSVGATVKRGEEIGKVGSTGNSTGPHLHFEIHKDGTAVDPYPILKNE